MTGTSSNRPQSQRRRRRTRAEKLDLLLYLKRKPDGSRYSYAAAEEAIAVAAQATGGATVSKGTLHAIHTNKNQSVKADTLRVIAEWAGIDEAFWGTGPAADAIEQQLDELMELTRLGVIDLAARLAGHRRGDSSPVGLVVEHLRRVYQLPAERDAGPPPAEPPRGDVLLGEEGDEDAPSPGDLA